MRCAMEFQSVQLQSAKALSGGMTRTISRHYSLMSAGDFHTQAVKQLALAALALYAAASLECIIIMGVTNDNDEF